MLELELAILNEPGGRDANEDACGWWHDDQRLCCVVADGAGGHGGGGHAARLAVKVLLAAFSEHPSSDTSELQQLVRKTNQQVRTARKTDPALSDMYTTIACVVIDLVGRRAHWAHAGDTRVYWFRHGHVALRSKDHSVVQSMADLGLLTQDELHRHPRRSELLSALGTDPDELEVGSGRADGLTGDGDVFLLCTDGLWEHVPDSALESALVSAPSAQDWLTAIETQVRANAAGTPRHDNFSAIAARVLENGAGTATSKD